MNTLFFVCPECHSVSYNKDDILHGYCGQCHAWTGDDYDDLFHVRSTGSRYRGFESITPNPKYL